MFLLNAVDHTVDKSCGFCGTKAFGNFDCFVDGNGRGDVITEEYFVSCQAQQAAVNGSQLIQAVIITGSINVLINFITMRENTCDELFGKVAYFWPGGTQFPEIRALIRKSVIVQVVTEQKLDRSLPGFSPGAWFFAFIAQGL